MALAPAEVVKVVLDEDAERIEVVVPDQQLSLAIGRKGQNVRLASQLTGWDIDIMTEASESERRQAEFAERSSTFMEALDVDEVIAQLLASEGFSSVEEVAFVEPSEIASIEGFDENTAAEIQARAREYLEKIETELEAKRKALGVADELSEVPGVNTAMLVTLGENSIKTVEDLADCATDDLAGWSERKDKETIRHEGILDGFGLTKTQVEDLILAARVKAGWITEADLAPEPVEGESEGEDEQPRRGRRDRRGGDAKRRERLMRRARRPSLRQAAAEQDHDDDNGADDAGPPLCAHPRAEAEGRADPLRARPRRRRRSGSQGEAAGPRRVADRGARHGRRRGQAQCVRPGAQDPSQGSRRACRPGRPAARRSGAGGAGLANKAGEAVFGNAKVEEAHRQRPRAGAPPCPGSGGGWLPQA